MRDVTPRAFRRPYPIFFRQFVRVPPEHGPPVFEPIENRAARARRQ